MSVPVAKPMGRSRAGLSLSRIMSRYHTGLMFWLLVGPFFLGTLLFSYGPLIWGFLISLYDSRMQVNLDRFVGLENYAYILHDPIFRKSLITVVLFAAFIVPTTYFVAMLLAVLVESIKKGKAIFRSIFFIPTAISYVIASLIWRMALFNGTPFGVANQFLWVIGEFEPIVWIQNPDPPLYWFVLVSCRLWLSVGFQMLLIIAAMQDIPVEMYEAARVDGADNGWVIFWKITFPLLRNISVFLILWNIIQAFNAFAEFYNILGGTDSSEALLKLARPPQVYLYQIAMENTRYGLASAGGFIVGILIIISTVIQNKITGGLGKEY